LGVYDYILNDESSGILCVFVRRFGKYSISSGVSLSATGYFDDKVRVTELGYFSHQKWQIGDVIAGRLFKW
jgi:hypothetical protein